MSSEEVIDNAESDNDDSNENIEMEIPDDMLDFFIQSMKHKQERSTNHNLQDWLHFPLNIFLW